MYNLNVKHLTLKDFKKEDYHFKTQFVDEDRTDYRLITENGIRIVLSQFCGLHPYAVTVYSPNGEGADAHGFDTPEDALNHLKSLKALNQILEIQLV
jgi:hypothetical protein